MKYFFLTLLSAVALNVTTLADALKFTDTDGKQHAGELSAVEPHAIALETDAGIIRVPLEKMPAELQARFGYKPDEAAKHKAALEADKAARLAQQAKVEVAPAPKAPAPAAKPASKTAASDTAPAVPRRKLSYVNGVGWIEHNSDVSALQAVGGNAPAKATPRPSGLSTGRINKTTR